MNINITPLTKDESNKLHGGFGIIKVSAELAINNKNHNCDSTLTSGDFNTNCNKCSCGSGGPVTYNTMSCTPPDTPAKP